MLNKHKKQAKKQAMKKQIEKNQVPHHPMQVTITLRMNGSVDVETTFRNLVAARGMVEQANDILRSAGEVRYNEKERAIANHIRIQQSAKQRRDAENWNKAEKKRLHSQEKKDDEK